MPELPEVEVIKTELESKLVGETIKNTNVYWEKTFVNHLNKFPNNSQISGLSRKGKYLILELNKDYIIIHLRMTGQVIISDDSEFSQKHLRLSMEMKSGKFMNFYDVRKFGRIYYTTNINDILSKVGIDAMSKKLDSDFLFNLLNKYNRKVKQFLLDQNIISGLGNIYTDESLFLSGIHPEFKTCNISKQQATILLSNIKKILKNATQNMGTTISDYKTTGGGFGGFQNKLKVYGRKGLPCFQCSTEINKIKLNGRGTHFCPTCQPENGDIK